MARRITQPVRLRVHGLLGALLCGGMFAVSSASAAAATTVSMTAATNATLSGWLVQSTTDPSATSGSAVKFGSSGTAQLKVALPADADGVTLRIRGDQCAGAPGYTLTIDGAPIASNTVASATWTTVTYPVALVQGTHVINVAFTNPAAQYGPGWCSRALYLDTVAFTSSGPLPSTPPIPSGYVHQSGTGLLDGAGHPVRLRGVNLGGWLEWQGWEWGPGFDYIGESAMMRNLTRLVGPTQAEQFRTNVANNFITSGDFHAMAVDGFNVARVPFNYRMLEDDAQPFVYKQSGWDILDRLVSEAKQANVYLILDMSVAPCSQMYAFTSDYVSGPYLWSSSQCQDRMVAMWKAIAARYAGDNVIAGYDVLNETIVDDASLLSLYKRVTAAIRQVDRNHMIIYEGNMMARTFTMFTAPLDSNEMLSFHDYPWAFPGQDLSVRMVGYDAAAKQIHAPQYAGEFGQSTYTDIQKYVTTFNHDPYVAAWTEWTWKQSPGFPALQTIQHTALSQKLINWVNNPTRPEPTLAEAQQGMVDFINAIRFENTLPDALMRNIMAAPAPPPVVSPTTTPTTPKVPTKTTPAKKPGQTQASARQARVTGCAGAGKSRKTRRHQRSHKGRAVTCQWIAGIKWDHRTARGQRASSGDRAVAQGRPRRRAAARSR